MSESKLNIGIVGAGKIVESIHLPVLLGFPELKIKWLYDKNVERVKLLSDMYGVDPYSDLDLIDILIKSVDICLIAIPYGVREEFLNKCAELGKCVYVEKPFARLVSQHYDYCSLFAPSDIAVGFQRRYYSLVKDVTSIITSKIFGNIKSIQFNQGYFQIKGGSGFLSNAKLSGGGVIIESAIHSLDQIICFTEATDLKVTELSILSRNGIDYDSTFTTHLITAEGVIVVNTNISCLKNLDNGIKIEFENAVMSFQLTINPSFRITNNKNQIHFDLTKNFNNFQKGCNSINETFVQFWKDFLISIRTKEINQTSAVSSLLTTKWIEQIYSGINKTND